MENLKAENIENKRDILKFSLEKGMLLDRETLGLLESFDSETAKKILEKISVLQEKMITRSFLTKNVEKIQEIVSDKSFIEKIKINFGITLEISREIEKKPEKIPEKKFGNVKVIYSLANLSKKISPGDFVNHFRNRYSEIKRYLQDRKELENLTSISKINGNRQTLSIIGLVYEKRVTKNKNIILGVEDLSGHLSVLISKTKTELYDKAKDILLDDILGIKGVGNQEIVYANDIYYPEAFVQDKNFLEKDESVAFISDIHIGSTHFLEENFKKFIAWINGEIGDEKQKQEAKKVKYLFITGDTIDGVGIFPGQEELLNIKDITEQYKKLAGFLSQLRKDIKIILCPGQHDSVRVAEPQPFIGKDFGAALYELDNLILVSNPALIEIGNTNKAGMKILMYHGASMNSFINEIETLRLAKAHDKPARVVKEILKRRHLAPLHGSVTYIPTEKEDPLVIKEIPDIIVTADLHKPDVDVFNNILIICCSCWQSTTPFEEKVGNHPDPCKVPVFNLKTREIKILDFSDTEEDKNLENSLEFSSSSNLKDLRCVDKGDKIVCDIKK